MVFGRFHGALWPALLLVNIPVGCGQQITPTTPEANCELVRNWLGSFKARCERAFPISDEPRAALRVASGDTLFVTGDSRRIRLEGVCANNGTEADMKESQAYLTNLVEGRFVRVHQSYSRPSNMVVARVFVGDVDLSAAMIEAGMASECNEDEVEPSLF